ncbi:hypothetical protein L210DRAFT_3519818 [Boletus edulis BED1]|uniref:Uncharacterized protein n=1 Tax=Boletus edulis BED1 TaxID=1328754 RepID=A0AAD4CAW6_BOLED|nr:hypothetical protein L210DRAFT_3519818 [Boletus edulis BED1]
MKNSASVRPSPYLSSELMIEPSIYLFRLDGIATSVSSHPSWSVFRKQPVMTKTIRARLRCDLRSATRGWSAKNPNPLYDLVGLVLY